MKIVKEEETALKHLPSQRLSSGLQGLQTLSGLKPRDQRLRKERIRYDDVHDNEQSVSQSLLHKRRQFENRKDQQRVVSGSIGLFTGEGLGIFEPDMKESSDLPKLKIWDRLVKDELEYIIAQPPRNGFEEMIKWTEEGKLWKYPINNEQG